MEGFKDHIKLFEDYIETFINDLNDNAVYEPIKYFLKLPSKRVRPLLTLISSSLYSDDIQNALPASLANEVFHNFTLVHDDIMDSSKIRRGNESVHIKWNVNQAILSGDAMQILAYKCLENYESKIQKKLLQIFNDTALKICEGQQLDIEFEKEKDLKFSDYIQMIQYKTAVLLGSSLKMGGIVNNASETDLELLYDIGLNLGLAFQIQDDYLDLFGSKKVGKQIGLDILNKKKTYLILSFYRLASPKHLQDFKKLLYSKNKQEENILKIIDLFNVYNIKEIVTSKLKKLVDNINSIIDNLAFSDSRKKQLKNYIKLLSERDK